MKNLKNLFLKSFILSAIFLLVSCNNDDDNTPADIHGTWQYIGYIEEGEFIDDLEECYSETIMSNNNKTGTITMDDCDFGAQTLEFNWGDIYTMSTESSGTTQVQITFDGSNTIHIGEPGDNSYMDVYSRR